MDHTKFSLRVLTVLGVVVGALILAMAMLTFVQAQGATASITIVKGPGQMVVRGFSASFDIEVINSGDVTLTNVTVSDAEPSTCDRTFAELRSGEHQSYSCEVAHVTDDFVNTATVTATTPEDEEIIDSDIAFVDVIDPGIRVAKTPDFQVVVRGAPVSFTIEVNNTGDVTLTDVTILDAQAPICEETFAQLAAGEHQSYSCVVPSIGGDLVNLVEATGTTPVGGEVSDSDTATVDVLHPDIQIAKTPDLQLVERGLPVSFNIAVTNTGEVTLTAVAIVDSVSSDCDAGFAELGVGESRRYTCIHPAVADDFTNTATASGTSSTGEIVTDHDSASVIVLPEVEIAKTPDDQVVPSGSTVAFTIAVTNSSDMVLDNVTVLDAQAPDCEQTLGQMLAWEHQSYTCVITDVTEPLINSATVTGTPTLGGEVASADAAKVRLDATQTCPADMLAYWRFDETFGLTYKDFYYGRHGVCAASCPSPTSGRIKGGQAFAGAGTDTGVNVPVVPGDHSFNWGARDSFSIEFWMKADSVNGCSLDNEVIVGRDDASSGNQLHWWVGIGCGAGGKATFILRDKSGDINTLAGTTDLTDGAWYHIVAVRDGSANENRIYVNGTEEASKPASYSAGFDSPTAALNIGWLNLSHGFHYDGILDEVAMYARALSADEVRQHRNEGLAERWYCEPGTFPPVIVSTPVTEITAGRPYIYDVEAAGNPAPTYTLRTRPNGMTIDLVTGLISWRPTVAQEGSHDVEVEASNSVGIDTQDFTIVVGEGTICPADMIAYWKLDETDVITYDDFYDGHNATCGSQCPTPTTGYSNGGQEFNGSNTEINVPVDEAFDWGPTDSFSVEFWVQTDSASTCAGNEVIVGRDDSSTQLHWWTGCWDGGQPAFYLIDIFGTAAWVTGTTDLADGSWHHVVATRDANANEIRIYVDGFEENSATATYAYGFDSATAALNIGWIDLAHGFHFNGVVDEVALYDRTLSPDEIRQQYNEGEAGPGYCINPEIAVSKTANPTVLRPDNKVTYTYAVSNPGDAPLSAVSPRDDKCNLMTPPAGDDDGDGLLDPSETWIYRCSMILAADITNTVTVTGSPFLGDIVSDTDTISVDVINPKMTVEKVADPTTVYAGDSVTYTYTVTNSGDDPLLPVNPSDDKCSRVDFVGGDNNYNYALDPDEVWVYTCAITLSTATTNTVTVTGTDSAGGSVVVVDTAYVEVMGSSVRVYLPLTLRGYERGSW